MTFVMILGGAIISLKIFGSVVKGRPLSSISSNNYTKLDIIMCNKKSYIVIQQGANYISLK